VTPPPPPNYTRASRGITLLRCINIMDHTAQWIHSKQNSSSPSSPRTLSVRSHTTCHQNLFLSSKHSTCAHMEALYFHKQFNFKHRVQRQYELLYTAVFNTRIYLISRYGLDSSAFVLLLGQEIFSSHPTRPALVLPRPVQWAPGLFSGGNAGVAER
jgi:hypothetical protein